ncbi:MAG: hypothetical protein KIT22_11005 [Verrucomicrobiae bacterium]|nr:hypothetical protein [Verrucomicrobiae bacterium]
MGFPGRLAEAPPGMSGSYQLVQLPNGSWSVRSLEAAETFHPVVGPVAEAEALYVRQLRVRQRLADAHEAREALVVWDVGLGAAANTLTLLQSVRDLPGRIRILSFDHTLEPLRFAVRNSARLGYFGGHEPEVETLLAASRAVFRSGALTVDWSLHTGDFPTALASAEAESWPSPHAILFDAYSPARNPVMWTLPLFSRLRELSPDSRPCALATYTRATLVRVTLLRAGWRVGIGNATGEKDETTVAANHSSLIERPLGPAWWARALRSTSAEPLRDAIYCQQPMSESTRTALEGLPPFRAAASDPGAGPRSQMPARRIEAHKSAP